MPLKNFWIWPRQSGSIVWSTILLQCHGLDSWFGNMLRLCVLSPVRAGMGDNQLMFFSFSLFLSLGKKKNLCLKLVCLIYMFICIFSLGGSYLQVGDERCTHLIVEENTVKELPFEPSKKLYVVKQEASN